MAKSKYQIKRPKMSQSKNNTLLLSLTKGLVFGYMITAFFFILMAFILTYTNMLNNPTHQNVMLIIVTVIAVIVAGLKTAGSYKDTGWLWGGTCGLLYFIIFFLISYLVKGSISITSNGLSMLLLCLGSGALGGVFGGKRDEG
ncbi:TIGR04086 family membrane protein [Vallitalea okinawensis]|uniref:TIGR04086 family membrane protein n=1 Tax=Vallitalea okinawensis TaxID=2078660 RepID=UPI000CFBFFD1|nr:TIGR04086 family membrane protein [Vallitalea okinawensis]